MNNKDLLLKMVETGLTGDRERFIKLVKCKAAEESGKNHTIYAEQLRELLRRHGGAPAEIRTATGTVLQRPGALWELKPRFALNDLTISEQNARACLDFVEEHRRADELRERSLTPRHKIMLAGPPGNGKTSLAEAIAQALEPPFLVVRYESPIGRYPGETSARLAKVIEYAKAAPCVLFFDEFDAVGRSARTRKKSVKSGASWRRCSCKSTTSPIRPWRSPRPTTGNCSTVPFGGDSN